MRNRLTFDAVVAGAGTSGSATAYQLADAGFRVAVVERGTLKNAGAHWVNAVPPWMFDRAGIARPEPPELRAKDFPLIMAESKGRHRIQFDRSPTWAIDMRHLNARLQKLAAARGVTFYPRTSALKLELESDRPVRLLVQQKSKQKTVQSVLQAPLFIDATATGVLRDQVPAIAQHCRIVSRDDICSAAQQVRRITDRQAAQRFFEKLGVPAEGVFCFTGLNGGFSTLYLQASPDWKTIDILTGATANPGYASGLRMIEDFVAENPWIGAIEFGGTGFIPLRKPFDRLAVTGLALVGNSACQVFPAHGSGVANGMIAGRILAEAIARHVDPGSLEAVTAYQSAYMREIGAVSASYDVFRKLSQTLTEDEVGLLFSSGIMSPAVAFQALDQRMPSLDVGQLPAVLSGVARAPGLAARFGREVAKMLAIYGLYRLYPHDHDSRWAHTWKRLRAAIMRG